MSVSTEKPRVVGNKKTEAIIGAAHVKMQTAVKSLTEASKVFENFDQEIEAKTLKLTNLEAEIESQEEALKRKLEAVDYEVATRYKTNEAQFVNEYARMNDMTLLKTEDHKNLLKENETLKSEQESKIKSEVAKITASLTSDFENKTRIMEAEYRAKEATNTAEINSLKKETEFLRAQNLSWKEQLESERDASIERAKAGQIGTLNVGSGSNGRG